jgi:cytochrome c553
MMTMLIQPRHTKLGLGIRARNWVYAGYEIGELRGAFGRVVASMPAYEGAKTADLMVMVDAPIAKVQAAIRAKDARAADAAYSELTDTCNACHGTQGRTYIDIRVPTTPMYSDQDFTPMR